MNVQPIQNTGFQSELKSKFQAVYAVRPLALALALAVSIAVVALSGCGTNNTTNPLVAESGYEFIEAAVAMRDGIELYTETLLPASVPAEGVPTLLLRTPYDLPTLPIGGLAPDDVDGSEDDENDEAPALTRAAWQPVIDRGYAVVFQNLRGTQSSGGRNEIFASEREDGVDTLEWIRSQPWSNGRVGAMGDSAAGFSVHLLAAENPPGLEATFAQVSCGDIWSSAILPDHGGVKLEAFLPFMLAQSLELGDEHLASLGIGDAAIESAEAGVMAALAALFGEDAAAQNDALSVQPFVDYPGVTTLLPQWRTVLNESARGEIEMYFDTRGQTTVPGMHVAMWQDIFVECTLGDFISSLATNDKNKLLVLDGSHYEIDDAASWPYLPMLDWFDHHLKDVTTTPTPTVQYVLQSARSVDQRSLEIQSADSWPPMNVEQVFYLNASGGMSEDYSAEDFSLSMFSDPQSPRSNSGGRHLVIDAGIVALEAVEERNDQLVFTAAAYEREVTIAGEVRLETSITADVADADIHARLVEMGADGSRVTIVEGMQRARYARSALSPMDLVANQPVIMNISLGNIAHTLAARSQLQLEISTSNFPAWNINPQVGGSSFNANGYQAGTINVLSTADNPSRLIVPTLP